MQLVEFILTALLVFALCFLIVKAIVALLRMVWYGFVGFIWMAMTLVVVYILFHWQ
jgi:hypothetical protein